MAKAVIDATRTVPLDEWLTEVTHPDMVTTYLETSHLGFCRVGHVRNPYTDPWAVCPDENGGFGLSFAIHSGTTMHLVEKGA